MNWLGISVMLYKINVRAGMQYRLNFILSTLLAALVTVSEFLGLVVLLSVFGAIQGWSVWEIGYLYGVLMTAKFLYRAFGSAINNFEPYLVNGTLDQLLLRPMPLLLAVLTSRTRMVGGELLQSLTVLGACVARLLVHGDASWWIVPETLLIICTGTVIMFAVGLATAACGFWITRTEDLSVLTDNATTTACQLPLSLFPEWLRTLLLAVIPFGFINYVPAMFIVRGEWGVWTLAATAAVAAAALLIALGVWKIGVTKYQSTGT
ncbi:ABC-2 family transporter protein [Cohnella nanjingensis]|uniref:ABC-2 family transporter protein n=1 Tax=Cohnella nanjingensis TaxID=1387779 RepID=A0A7X0RQH0_9BACL|nr:ABC-2 family transporter protein [Cohnella nanjingensis]MBB6670545.1 ABC-2 family transporter protein [Cohnella nanjingensis]